jgi:hypothetical protein
MHGELEKWPHLSKCPATPGGLYLRDSTGDAGHVLVGHVVDRR